nr:MAG TPA: hypothetical protein [Caudoviricetes sp.]
MGRSGSARSAPLKRFLGKVPADRPLRDRHRHWRSRRGDSAWEVPRAMGTAPSGPVRAVAAWPATYAGN